MYHGATSITMRDASRMVDKSNGVSFFQSLVMISVTMALLCVCQFYWSDNGSVFFIDIIVSRIKDKMSKSFFICYFHDHNNSSHTSIYYISHTAICVWLTGHILNTWTREICTHIFLKIWSECFFDSTVLWYMAQVHILNNCILYYVII